MKVLAWKLNRLRAMGATEVGYRGTRWLMQGWERLRLAACRPPLPASAVGPAASLLPGAEGWLSAWEERYALDSDSLGDLFHGRMEFFGHGVLEVGDPVDWHRDPLTGVRAPMQYGKTMNYRDDRLVGDVKVLWELGRHQHLVPLALAYACGGDRAYRDAVCAHIDGWIRANPYGYGIHWCSALEVALRVLSWAFVHSLLALRDGPAGLFACVSDHGRVGIAIYHHAAFIRGHLSRHSSANNHLIGELTGLWVATQVFDLGAAGRRWAEQARAELEREAGRQVWEDGVDKEQAVYYHLWVLEYLMVAWLAGIRAGRPFSDRFRDRIVRMAGFLAAISPRGGPPPQVGDADDGVAVRFEAGPTREPFYEMRAAVAEVFSAPRLTEAGRPLPQKAFWYALCAGRLPGRLPASAPTPGLPRVFPQGGYALLGGGDALVLFDAGHLGYPSIAAHGHADALSFCLSIAGEWWLVDPGTYAYHSEPAWRDYFRGSAAHNTVTVDGHDQSRIGGPFLWLDHACAWLEGHGADAVHQWVEGVHTGYARYGIRHRRRLEFFPEEARLEVSDTLEGKGVHDFRIRFHFAPRLTVRPFEPAGGWVAAAPDSEARLIIETDSGWSWEVVRGREIPPLGWYSPALGRKEPASTLEGSRIATAPVEIRTVFRIRPT